MPTIQPKEKVVKAKSEVSGVRVDEALMAPGKYEITSEHTFEVKIYLRTEGNRWVVVSGPGKGVDEEKVVFRMWSYDEIVSMRKAATSFDAVRRLHLVDTDLLDRLKVQKLMQSWTLDKDNPRLKVHRVNDVLTDESWSRFTKLHPNIIRRILDGMNEILEYNG
jgi:hypothetical protein